MTGQNEVSNVVFKKLRASIAEVFQWQRQSVEAKFNWIIQKLQDRGKWLVSKHSTLDFINN